MSDQQAFVVEPDAQRRLWRWPHVPSTRQLAILVCAHGPGPGRVSVSQDGDIQIDFEGPLCRGQIAIERRSKSFVLFLNDVELAPHLRRQGIITDSFLRLVTLTTSWGFRRIQAIGAGSARSDVKGYYVLPKLGFEGKIPVPIRQQFPHAYRGAKTVLELYDLPGGDHVWNTHGRNIALSFDLSPNSMSLKALWQYLHKKGKLPPGWRWRGKAGPRFDLDLSERDEEALRQAWEEIRRQKKRRSAS